MRRTFISLVAIAIGLTGCQPTSPTAPEDTGSNKAVTEFFEAIVQQDWPRGLAVLTGDKNERPTNEQFGRQAQAYRNRLGFDPEEVHVRSCEEHGSEAVAHVVLIGHLNGQRKQFRESVALRRNGGKWVVLRPKRF